MPRLLWALIAVTSVAGSVAPAAAQTPARLRPAVLITPVPGRASVVMQASATAVVNRILSFDTDGDDRVTGHELPERMQSVVGRADQDGDRFLTAHEIEQFVRDAPAGLRTDTFSFRVQPLGLADVVHDLRLPAPKHERALALVTGITVPRNVNDPRRVELYARMRELLDDEEYENFVAAAARVRSSAVVFPGGGAFSGGDTAPSR